MSALSIQPTYPIFTESNGLPLEAGYIWIGAANLDPQGNPINVYWDAALTIAAPQPIRTLNGYPSRSGTPARLYVNSDYSIRVQNSKGSLVYSAPQATERYSDAVISSIDASQVSYTPAGANAVQTNVEVKLLQQVSVFDFMTPAQIADVQARSKLVDVTTAIQNAIDQVESTGGGEVIFPPGDYRTNTSIVLKDQVTLRGTGVPSRTNVDLSPTRIFHYGNSPGVWAKTPTLIGEFCLKNLEFNGINAGAFSSGLVMDAQTGGGAIVGTKAYDCTFCNFPNYQVLQNGTVFDNTFENCTFHSYGQISGDTYHVGPDGSPTQQSFINCFFIPNTTQWAFRTETATNPRFIGGTIGPTNIAGNGISVIGGLFLYGTHIEALGGGTGIGIFYKGSTGAFISPAECILFDIGVLIGDGGSDTARGWVIAGSVGANTTYDVKISSGGPRAGTLCETGFIGGTRSIYDERATIDKVYEVSRVDASFPTFQGTFTPTVVGSTAAGTATYTIQDGLYQIAGKIFTYTLRVQYSGHTGTGNLLVGGFPNNASNQINTATFRVENIARTAGTQLTGFIAGTSKRFNLEQMTAAGAISPVPMSAAGDITITGQFFLL